MDPTNTALEWFNRFSPFGLKQKKKQPALTSALRILSGHHYRFCNAYRTILHALCVEPAHCRTISEIPFLPVRLFKELELKSVPPEKVHKVMTSSGTTGQKPSLIFLDQRTSANQVKVLLKVVCDFMGTKRLPMLIIDSPSTVMNRQTFSARAAGILGFSLLGTDLTYALNDAMEIDYPNVDAFLRRHLGQDIFVFGFTSIVWEVFHALLARTGKKLPLDRGILIHGGGWKKLTTLAVDNTRFRQDIENSLGIHKIYNYYGMIEQTGSIFMECEKGYFHASNYSDVIIRRSDLSDAGFGETGLVQLLSLLPSSYPGHSILSEDMGRIFGEDDCACGRFGKYFKIFGRVENAEIRGCSDTFAR